MSLNKLNWLAYWVGIEPRLQHLLNYGGQHCISHIDSGSYLN